jgi:integron integrase
MESELNLPESKAPRLLERAREAMRVRHLSLRTEKAYLQWMRRYIVYHGKRHPSEMGEREINAFLTFLAVEKRVSPSTQTQALCALLFLYRTVLERDIGELEGLVRARRRRRLPVVLTQDEVRRVLSHLRGVDHLLLSLLYGTGMRLLEGLRLRVKDVELDLGQITVRDGKGGKDRVTMLPASLESAIRTHLLGVSRLHEKDMREGGGRVSLPYALERKYPNAGVVVGDGSTSFLRRRSREIRGRDGFFGITSTSAGFRELFGRRCSWRRSVSRRPCTPSATPLRPTS